MKSKPISTIYLRSRIIFIIKKKKHQKLHVKLISTTYIVYDVLKQKYVKLNNLIFQ